MKFHGNFFHPMEGSPHLNFKMSVQNDHRIIYIPGNWPWFQDSLPAYA